MLQKTLRWLCIATAISSAAVAADEATPLANSSAAPAKSISVAPTAKPNATYGEITSLQNAIDRALAGSPRLKSFASARMASKAELRQAEALPNPNFSVEAEDIAGKGEYSGFKSAEITYGVSQLVEIGGKRSARRDVASQSYQIAGFEYESARLDVIRDVTIAHVEAVAAKEAVTLAEKRKALAAEVLKNVTQRVNAAAEPLFQKSKAEVALSTSDIALDKAQRDYTIARKQLAAQWGEDIQAYDLDASQFVEIIPPIPLEVAAAKQNPDLLRWDAELAKSKANFELERANSVPDPSIEVGVSDFRESGDRAFVAGLSIPVPVFNANGGNIAKARHEVNKTESEKRASEISLSTELIRAQQELEHAYRQAQSLKDTVIPAAEKAYSLSRQGYTAGKFPYLEVLDAQRTLVETLAEYNAALKEYHLKRATVERLTAKYLPANNEKDEANVE